MMKVWPVIGSRRRGAGALAFAALLILASACSPRETAPAGPMAPDFTVRTVDGSDFTLSDHRGKVVVLFAMAAWCPSCTLETRALSRIYREYGDRGVEVLILDVWPEETEAQLLDFKSRAQGGDHFWALDIGNRWASAYQVKSLDTTVIVDRGGRIAYRDGSPTPYKNLKAEVEPLLQ